MASLGPVKVLFDAADALAWAHLHVQKSLSMAPLGPINFIKKLPMHLHGPICIHKRSSPMVSRGPVKSPEGAVDILARAHMRAQRSLPMASLGPIRFPFSAADALAWAHLHLQKSLPMAPLGPINFIKEVADALAWAHLHSQEVIADGLAWAR